MLSFPTFAAAASAQATVSVASSDASTFSSTLESNLLTQLAAVSSVSVTVVTGSVTSIGGTPNDRGLLATTKFLPFSSLRLIYFDHNRSLHPILDVTVTSSILDSRTMVLTSIVTTKSSLYALKN